MTESWKTINELLKKRSKSCNVDFLKASGNTIVNKKDTSDTMNNFFCTIGKKLASKIDAVLNPLLAGDYGGSDKSVRFQFRTIDVKEVRDAIAKTKT